MNFLTKWREVIGQMKLYYCEAFFFRREGEGRVWYGSRSKQCRFSKCCRLAARSDINLSFVCAARLSSFGISQSTGRDNAFLSPAEAGADNVALSAVKVYASMLRFWLSSLERGTMSSGQNGAYSRC